MDDRVRSGAGGGGRAGLPWRVGANGAGACPRSDGDVLDTVKGADLGGDVRDGVLVLDLNFADNPSCAHDPAWACPLAPPGNVLSAPVRAGELYLQPSDSHATPKEM